MKLRIADCGLRNDESRDCEAAEKEQNHEGVSRRKMMKLTAGAVIASSLSKPETDVTAVQGKAPLFFTRAEFAMVDELTELIIPTDDHSPGARAAKVAAYIDYRLAESLEEETKKLWREGLKLVDGLSREMHGQPLMKASAEQRTAVLARMAQNEANPQQPEEKFFRELKRRTVRAYYTSKIGIHTEIEYKGNTYLKEFVGEEAKIEDRG
jgi:ribosomal protein S18